MGDQQAPISILEDMARCTGCGACMAICPVSAIRMLPDDEGFLFPGIDHARCTRCRACVRVCPVNASLAASRERQDDSSPPTYACWAADEALRTRSSSGGAFGVLARAVLNAGGVVFGAAFVTSESVAHRMAQTHEALEPLLRSKYVQSDTGDSFLQVRGQLNSGRRVLFCGTPCQVAGLVSFLGGRPAGLLTCDFVCSGVPSPLAWRTHLDGLARRHGGRASAVSFRSKTGGWRKYRLEIRFDNGATYRIPAGRDPFFIGFGMELFNRRSCADCRFRTLQSAADLTLADYWGIWKHGVAHPAFRDNRGVSLVVVHTPAGAAALSEAGDALCQVSRTYGEAEADNPRMTSSRPPSPQRKAYFQAVRDGVDPLRIQQRFMNNTGLAYHLKALARKILPESLRQRLRRA